jgi:DNA-binding response OmpR family regulator
MKILIVDDEVENIDLISVTLKMRWPDLKVIGVSLGEKGLELAETESPDVIILDIGLPDISGFEVLKGIRLFSEVPILILTAKNEESDIVKGLEWGADDFLTKPFKHLELQARVNGIIKRHNLHNEEILRCGNLRFEMASLQVWSGIEKIKISHTEGLILAHLMRNAGNVVTYSSISKAIWADDFPDSHDSIKVHVRHLREKLEKNPAQPEIILNQSGVGYFLALV